MTKKNCFVIMPISDPDGYENGHFLRVYKHLIKPACEAAGYDVVRADDVQSTNHIVLDILTRIIESDMVLCDLSAKNPNVLYELGIRQAFDKSVVLVKDQKTERIFDIQGIRTLDYDSALRIDHVNTDLNNIKLALEATANPSKNDINSLVKILGVAKATPAATANVSPDAAVILSALKDLSDRITRIEDRNFSEKGVTIASSILKGLKDNRNDIKSFRLSKGSMVEIGDLIFVDEGDRTWDIGELTKIEQDGITIKAAEKRPRKILFTDEIFRKLTDIPF